MVRNTTEQEPSEVIDFEEMWKITVGNYYIGSGCISVGMQNLAKSSSIYTWDALVDQMVGDCKNADQYVDRVMHSSD
ncbi:MAG: hypothetical protein MUO62_05350 [Anaerolineales bacterium]|nr:hypothetical protein [Anaerolineales bacterium]